MACESCRESLDCYLDGELAPAEAAVLQAHLRTCAACAGEVLERIQAKRLVHTAGKLYAPSAEFRRKITNNITAKSSGGRVKQWNLVLLPAMLLLIAAFLLGSFFNRQLTARHSVFSELADLHVATLAGSAPVDVVSSDRHTVKPWFQGKIPFTFNLPELVGTEFTLLGGRVFYLQQTPGAHLIYQIRKHDISVFILPDRTGTFSRLAEGSGGAMSFNMETWTKNGLRYFMVGDANPADLRALAKLLKDAG